MSARRPLGALCRQSVTLAACVVALLLAPADVGVRADDTELYLTNPATSGTPARANILFIIDTSGSMGTRVSTQEPYNATTDYAGCFEGNALYFTTTGARPECGATDFVARTANRCAAAGNRLQFAGYYSDGWLAWNAAASRWEAPSADNADWPLECQADRGRDGDLDGAARYAVDGSAGPWSPDPSQEPAWTRRYTVFDGNWLNWNLAPPTVERTRLEVVQSTVETLANSLDNVNVGVMRFNPRAGGVVSQAVQPLEQTRGDFIAAVTELTASGSTPLSETLYEAALYLSGGTVLYGNRDFRSVADSRVGSVDSSNTYQSPVSDPCSRNFIILLTDGEPADDTDADNRIPALPGFGELVGSGCNGSGEGRCLDDLAEYLNRRDLSPDVPGIQNVVTHTIGFQLDLPLLADTARRGGGEYHLADDIVSLSDALAGIVVSIQDNAGSFAAPAIPVNVFNRAENSEDAYLAVFQASERARWPGNLKKYRLAEGELRGRDGPAIDLATGFFRRDAWSFWSPGRDGDRVDAGGAASRLPAWQERRLYTDVAGGDLSASGNAVAATNTAITAALLRAPEAERTALLEWARGRDAQDADNDGDRSEERRQLGDALHAQPVALSYGASADDARTVVFLATNEGILHAVDAETGVERWAYMPSRLLPQLYALYRNEPVAAKLYGLDGEITLHVRNRDGRPGVGTGDQAVLLFGMGRGGNAVYAIDVTDPDDPQRLWEIDGSTTGFADLGQTWSRPVVTRVGVQGAASDEVVIFGGGYDPGQDNRNFRTDSVGNAVYMVDLQTGTLLWSAGSPAGVDPHDLSLPAMQHSIPAGVRVVDLTRDGRADRMYVGDMGGRIWRFDILNDQPRSSLVEGGVLASLGAAEGGSSPDPATVRRFYETPDVVPIARLGQVVLTVNVGSGYRGRPLDTAVDEAFYSVRDLQALRVIPTAEYGPPITANQLVDITTNTAPTLPVNALGWQLRLVEGAGEKVLGESLTLRNNVFFTSFTPGARANSCVASIGTNRLYRVSLFDGSPLTNQDTTVEPDASDRFVELGSTSTGLEPIAVFSRRTGDAGERIAELRVCVGMECRDLAPLAAPVPTYWYPGQAPTAP